jgi:hypothetical protein
MTKKRKRLTDADLRADPDYQELCRLLEAQKAARKEKLTTILVSQDCEPSQYEGTIMDTNDRINELRSMGLSYAQIAGRLNEEGLRNEAGGQFTKGAVEQRYRRAQAKSQPSQPSHQSQSYTSCEPSETCEEALLSQQAHTCETNNEEPGSCDTNESCENLVTAPLSGEPCEPCESEVKKATGEACASCEVTSGESSETCDSEPTEPQYSEPCEPSQNPVSDLTIAGLRNLIRSEIAEMMSIDSAKHANIAKLETLPPLTPRIKGTKKFQGERVTLPGARIDKNLFELFESERRNLAISASELMQRILWAHFGKPRLSFEESEHGD